MEKEKIKKRIEELEEQYDTVSDQLYEIEKEIKELQNSFKGLYVGVIGIDCDYYIYTHVYVIGTTTYDEAKSFMEKKEDEERETYNCINSGYDIFEISKEIEDKLRKLSEMNKLLNSLDRNKKLYSSNESYKEFCELVRKDKCILKKELEKELQDKTEVYIVDTYTVNFN